MERMGAVSFLLMKERGEEVACQKSRVLKGWSQDSHTWPQPQPTHTPPAYPGKTGAQRGSVGWPLSCGNCREGGSLASWGVGDGDGVRFLHPWFCTG